MDLTLLLCSLYSHFFFPLPVCSNNQTLPDCKPTGLRDKVKDKLWKPNVRSERTWKRSIVRDEAGHVYVLVVDAQVLHAAHELAVADGKVLWEFWDPSKKQGAGQVQGSENASIYT